MLDRLRQSAKQFAERVTGVPTGERTGRQTTGHVGPILVAEPAIGQLLTATPTAQRISGLSSDMALRAGIATGLSTYSTIPGYPAMYPDTYAVKREMSNDPTFALAIATANSPIMAASWGYEADDGVPEDRLEWFKRVFETLKPKVVRECLRAREFGWRGAEKVFQVAPKSGLVEYAKFKPLWPDRTVILVDKDTGAFAGFRQGKIDLGLDRAFIYTHDRDCDDYYGNALHNNGMRAWANWLATIDNGHRLQRKVSGVIVQLHYPIGASKDATGVEVDNAVIAQRILDSVAQGKSVAMPNLFYSVNNNPEAAAQLAGKSMWVLSTITVGDIGAGSTALFDHDQRYWDQQKMRAWLVPERAATEGQFGTKAEAETHGDIVLTVAEQEHANIVREVNPQLADPLLVYNFGEDAKGSIRIVPEPIVDETRATLKELFNKLIEDPGRFEGVLAGEHGDPPDFDAIMDQLGLPRTSETERVVRGIVTDAQQIVSGEEMPPSIQERIANDYKQAHAEIDGPPSAQRDTGVAVDQALNGAQITAAIDLMSQLRVGTIVKDVAIELLVAVGIPRERAARMVQATVSAPLLPVESNGNGQAITSS